MTIAVTTTQSSMCSAYAALGNCLGLATGAPGSTSTPSNEASGGSYVRVATTWGTPSSGVMTGSAVTIAANAATYTYALLASATSGNNMIDNAEFSTAVVLSAAGEIVLTPSYTQR